MSSITAWGGQAATKYLTAYPNPRGRRTSRLQSQVTHYEYRTKTPTDNSDVHSRDIGSRWLAEPVGFDLAAVLSVDGGSG